MLLGVVSAVLMLGAGLAALRMAGARLSGLTLGLAPGVGVATLAIVSTWLGALRVPEPIVGLMVLVLCMVGLVTAARHAPDLVAIARCRRVEGALLAAAMVIPVVVLMQSISVQAGVPDYVHDGASHAELIQGLRSGTPIESQGWYPTGFHAPAAGLLSLVGAIDSATGAVGWAAGLTILAPLAVFGLTFSLWRDGRAAAISAVLLAITYNFPYEPHLYSVWPNAAALLLLLALWTLALEYLARPQLRLALIGAVIAAAVLLTHGTEVYTALIVLTVFAAACWRTVLSRRVAVHLGMAAITAVVLVIPYLPVVARWTSTGGAVTVGTDYFDFRHGALQSNPLLELLFWSSAIGSGLLVDLVPRMLILALGGLVAFQCRLGRATVALSLVFVALVAVFRYIDAPLVRDVFAVTLPWGVDGRLLMVVPLLTSPIAALGVLRVGAWAARTPGRAKRAYVFALACTIASVFLVAEKFSIQTSGVVTFAPEDAAAFRWVRAHAASGDVLMNDGAADAGIWAPYKANVRIVLPRTLATEPGSPEILVRSHIGDLATRPDVERAACDLGITYLYRGAANSPSELRQFPPLDQLRSNPALEEVFSSGDAAVFRTRLRCS